MTRYVDIVLIGQILKILHTLHIIKANTDVAFIRKILTVLCKYRRFS